jgi:hypothetical protein
LFGEVDWLEPEAAELAVAAESVALFVFAVVVQADSISTAAALTASEVDLATMPNLLFNLGRLEMHLVIQHRASYCQSSRIEPYCAPSRPLKTTKMGQYLPLYVTSL